MTVLASIEAPPGGAIAIIRLRADTASSALAPPGSALDAALTALNLPHVAPGRLRLASILTIDRGLLVRWSPDHLDLMLHGGPAIVEACLTALTAAGIEHPPRAPAGATTRRVTDHPHLAAPPRGAVVGSREDAASTSSPHTPDITARGGAGEEERERSSASDGTRSTRESTFQPPLTPHWPETTNRLEAAMLDALAFAPSPRAVDLLLAQPARHAASPHGPFADHPALRHLLAPPLVVIAGPPNIGKSTLLNRLARERLSVVADQAGTTRDAVAATVTLDGLTVRLLDLPGLQTDEPDPLIREAAALARHVRPDLILACHDAAEPHASHFNTPTWGGDVQPPILDTIPWGGGFQPPVLDQSARGGNFQPPVLDQSAWGGGFQPPVLDQSAWGGNFQPPVLHQSAWGGGFQPPVLHQIPWGGGFQPPVLPLLLRADRAQSLPQSPEHLPISSQTGLNLDRLPVLIRQTLVPDSALTDPRPWRFW